MFGRNAKYLWQLPDMSVAINWNGKQQHYSSFADSRRPFELPRRKTNNVVSEQVRHKSGCTVTEAGWKHEISDLKRRESVLSV